MQEFINLLQGGIILKEYSLKFTQLSKYSLTIVADSRAKMNILVMGVSDLVVYECGLAMLIPSIEFSRLIVHNKQIEGKNHKQFSRELKRTRFEDGNSSKARFEMQDKPRLKNVTV